MHEFGTLPGQSREPFVSRSGTRAGSVRMRAASGISSIMRGASSSHNGCCSNVDSCYKLTKKKSIASHTNVLPNKVFTFFKTLVTSSSLLIPLMWATFPEMWGMNCGPL